MKSTHMSWRWAIAIGLLMLNLVIGLWPMLGPSSAQEAKRFVYRVADVPGDTQALQTVLNEYGGGGWELVVVAIGEMQVPRLIFKK
ncbi:MAG: hypothetical protein Q8N04_09820 [Nitrospira sp.]|nr:hypothetical protein [Nitrospira sp.]